MNKIPFFIFMIATVSMLTLIFTGSFDTVQAVPNGVDHVVNLSDSLSINDSVILEKP